MKRWARGPAIEHHGVLQRRSGDYALPVNTTGSSNTATGAAALFYNTTGNAKTPPAVRFALLQHDGQSKTPAECAPYTRTRRATIIRPAVSDRFSPTIRDTKTPPAVSTPSGPTRPAPPIRLAVTRRYFNNGNENTACGPGPTQHNGQRKHRQRGARTLSEHDGVR